MGDRERAAAVIALLTRRGDLLAALRTGPTDKPSLVAQTDTSRSTVERSLQELSAAGLVESADGEYRLTLYGRVVTGEVGELRRGLTVIRRASDVLGRLPPEAPLDAAVVRAGTLHRGPDAGDRFDALLGAAGRVGLLIADDTTGLERLLAPATAASKLEVVIPPSVTQRLATGDDQVPTLSAAISLRETADPPPFTLLALAQTTDACGGVCGHADGSIDWLFTSDAPAARSWARSSFDRRWEAATPVRTP